MVQREFRRLCIQPTEFIDRKIMLYPINNTRDLLSHYLIIDLDCHVICENATVPHYPQVGDVVRLNPSDEIKLVSSVNADKCCCCYPMCKVGGRNSHWTVNRTCCVLITNNFIPETANVWQNGYQTVPFGVYIHNLVFVFILE